MANEEEKKPDEKKRKKKGNHRGFGGRKFNTADLLNTSLRGDSITDYHTFESRRSPGRVATQKIRDKSNPKLWYIKYVNITPAANVNRPMEPIFNVAFSKNGTSGVPKFVELDVEWKGFADTFMMDQISYSAMQQIRKALKSNLTYTDAKVKACIVNGLALLIFGKMLERDVHWNLYSGSNDFNFAEMFRQQNQVVNTYGIVPLYPKRYLLDESLPYTATIYNKVVSLFNQVIKLPKYVSEFCSHYFGSLFTLDKDGHNDQYLRINMHEIDWFENNDPENPGVLDISSLDIDTYLELLNAYSREFAVLLADLEKCLGVNAIHLMRYDEYTYAFIYDKSLLQALINGYTDNTAVNNNYIRLDRMSGVDDDLTQFIFLGGLQGDIQSKADVHAIRILDMVLKCNSDQNIDWPKLLDQYPFSEGASQSVKLGNPFGLSITTKFITDDVITVASSESAEPTIIPIPTYPRIEPGNSGNTGLLFNMGSTGGTRFPSSDVALVTDSAFRANHSLCGLIYLGAVQFEEGGTNFCDYVFAITYKNYAQMDSTENLAFNGQYVLRVSGTINQIRNVEQGISRDPRSAVWFMSVEDNNIDNSIKTQMDQNFSISAQGVTIQFGSSNAWSTYPLTTQLYMYVRRSSSGDTFYVYDRVTVFGASLIWAIDFTPNTFRYSLVRDQQAAPNGFLVAREISVTTALIESNVSVNSVCYGEGLPMFVSQVIDYHIPIYYNRRHTITVVINDEVKFEENQSSLPVLIKEDYVPYYYNVLDLIPVLYEMFVSLFSIDSVRKDSFHKSK